ncbi:uncharacterized protein ACRADG_003034 [Cochliomyia hominivorax]
MNELLNDAVINTYHQLLNKTQSDKKLPEFSEIYLRLAFKEVLGRNHIIPSDNLQLYRKLLVLYYCDIYPFLKSVITIMERCFTIDEIHAIIAEKESLLKKWSDFVNNFINDNRGIRKRKASLVDNVILEKKVNIVPVPVVVRFKKFSQKSNKKHENKNKISEQDG